MENVRTGEATNRGTVGSAVTDQKSEIRGKMSDPSSDLPSTISNLRAVRAALIGFTRWLQRHGETSFDHQSFFGGPAGRAAKRLYYTNKLLGTAAVAPMIFFEAFVP